MSTTIAGEKWLTVKQVVARTGFSKSLIYALVQAGKLRAYRGGLGRGTIRIDPASVPTIMRFNDTSNPH